MFSIILVLVYLAVADCGLFKNEAEEVPEPIRVQHLEMVVQGAVMQI